MFRPKPLKRQLPDKTAYTGHNPHTRALTERKWDGPTYVVASIDPGTVNFALRVESRPQKKEGGGRIVTLLYKLICLTGSETDMDEGSSCTTYRLLLDVLDEHLALFRLCHIILIERQLPINYRAVRMSQHALSYFMISLKDAPLLPLILEVDPKLKGSELQAPPGINDSYLKKWAVEKAQELMQIRGDREGLAILNATKKKDDLADSVCQIEAMFSLFQLPLTADIYLPNNSAQVLQVPVVPTSTSISTFTPVSVPASISIPASSGLTLRVVPPMPSQGTTPPMPSQGSLRLVVK